MPEAAWVPVRNSLDRRSPAALASHAAQLAQEAFSDSDKRTDAFASIALSWGSRDPLSAREWARTLAGCARERVDAELALLGAP